MVFVFFRVRKGSKTISANYFASTSCAKTTDEELIYIDIEDEKLDDNIALNIAGRLNQLLTRTTRFSFLENTRVSDVRFATLDRLFLIEHSPERVGFLFRKRPPDVIIVHFYANNRKRASIEASQFDIDPI
jgi:hypothetical protein